MALSCGAMDLFAVCDIVIFPDHTHLQFLVDRSIISIHINVE